MLFLLNLTFKSAMPITAPPQSIATILSSKGQVVIPKELRDARQWQAGMNLIVEEVPQGLLIRAAKTGLFPVTTIEDVMGCARYEGPTLSDKEIAKKLKAAALRRYGRSKESGK